MNKTRRIKGRHATEHYIPELIGWTPKDKKWNGQWGWFTIKQLITHPQCVARTTDILRDRMNRKGMDNIWLAMTKPLEKKNLDTTEFDNFLKIMWLFKPCGGG